LQDLWLIFQCQRGNAAAFAALYERHRNNVFRTALHLVRDRALAEDITQEAFISVFQEIGRLRTPGAFRTWLYRIVVSRATRLLRSEGGERRPLSLSLLPDREGLNALDPATIAADEVEVADLRRAIAALPEELRLVVLLHYYAELPVAEVSKVLGIPAGTVKSRLYTARERLAAALTSDRHPLVAKEMSL
jgi:RNA polymerase sigma-70 factor (ECF subfamily)